METSLLRGRETRRGGKLWNVYQDFGIFDWGTFQGWERQVKTFWSYPGTKNTRRSTGKTRRNKTSGTKYKKKYRRDKEKYNFWKRIQEEIQERQGKIKPFELLWWSNGDINGACRDNTAPAGQELNCYTWWSLSVNVTQTEICRDCRDRWSCQIPTRCFNV